MFMFAFIDMFIDSIDYALQGETMGMHKVRIVSLSPKAVSEQDGIVEVPEETDFSGITSLNKTACSSTVSTMHCKEKQWECTKCESLSPKAVSKQDGIVEVPEETDFSGITSLNKTVPFKILCL
ncbi:hypothetical protein T01_4724 [Trichinella spiralis]|uniref:Uncharacterized protein n=1 Tax=Trichinella spiralis TaxID=6334 RepID=A0A0V1BA57_TRISP|nr:hypothetical protein T01_4724 [Trichinella spiralis]